MTVAASRSRRRLDGLRGASALRRSGTAVLFSALALSCVCAAESPRDELFAAFDTPPVAARPHIWWHWMNGNVSKAGITADLESMAKVGLGGVQLFDAGLELPEGPVAFGTDAWFDHVAFAARECERLGLSFGIANCSGWTSSGGPWVTPEHAMKTVTAVSTNLAGPASVTVPPPPANTHGFYEDIALLAFPKPPVVADIPDLPHQTFRLRGDEVGPVDVPPIPGDAFPPGSCVATNRIVDLTSLLGDGASRVWRAPAGDWTLVRIGYACNGRRNRPPSKTGDGLETDKLSRRATDIHFDAYVARVAASVGNCRAFDNALIDSYEVGGQNWTRGFAGEFAKRRGYKIVPYLPILAGRPVESVAVTRKFLADYRKTIGELFVENYARRFAERCHSLGLQFACEPYGNGPFNDLDYAAECDLPMGEFWTQRGDGVSMWTRWGHRYNGNGSVVAAAARFWGRETIGAEAFTAYPTESSGRWLEHPASMKAQGDRVLAEGVNRFYFHRFAHQPWTNPTRYPGMTMAFYGSHFERTQTWWNSAFAAYVKYLTRIQSLLRRGRHVSDVLVCCPDEAPSFGTQGEVPDGWKADRCTERGLKEQRGRGLRPDARYRLVVRPEDDIAARLRAIGCARDFVSDDSCVSWDHRRVGEDEIYFLATCSKTARRTRLSFRDFAPCAEVWNPETGEIHSVGFRVENGRAVVDLDLEAEASRFVVFRKRPTAGAKVLPQREAVDGKPIPGPWKVTFFAPGKTEAVAATNFTQLTDWTHCREENIRYFSGTAIYETDVAVGDSGCGGERMELDLGEVRDMAEVEIDGKAFRTLWRAPFRLDVTEAVRGRKTFRLTVKVTNRWPNRLIGDERFRDQEATWKAKNRWKRPIVKAMPEWIVEDRPSPSGSTTFTTCRLWRAEDEPLPSGLLGPVRLLGAAAKSATTGDGEKTTLQEGDSTDIPLAPPKYRRPPNYRLETYPKSLQQLSDEYSEAWMARAKKEMARIDKVNAEGPYRATGESLDRHTCPEWFMDAKFGVQVDWNLSSIPSWSPYRLKSAMYPDWYELRGYREDWPTNSPFYGWYEYHKKNWGADFRRDHFINLFKAEKFDADALCKTFRACGIRYVLPFMKHHGGYCHWDSSWTFRNAVEMCPHRNFAAEYRAACDKYGLKFGFYFSNGEWEYPMLREDGTIEMYKETKRREPWTPEMEKVASGKVAVRDYNRDYSIPQAVEFIDKYKPDFLYYDYDWMQYADQLGVYDISAYFYNVNHGKKPVAINDRYGWGRPKDMAGRIPKGKKRTYKSQRCVRGDYYTDEFGDNSKSLDPANYHPFICCRGISSAYGNHWQDSEKTVLSHRELIVLFTSLVARGGNLELMVNLDAQGDIPALQLDRLEAIGRWLKRWGEAIYSTRIVAPYSTPEVDYTRSKDGGTIYAIVKHPAAGARLACRVPSGARIAVVGDEQAKVAVERGGEGDVRVTLPPPYAQSDLPIALKVILPKDENQK